MSERHFPALEVNLDAMRQNAKVLCDLCAKNGIAVAGVIKFSDGDLQVAKAYADGTRRVYRSHRVAEPRAALGRRAGGR